MNKLVCAILVNYNGLDDTNACVDSLLHCSYKNLKVIIVDNNSEKSKAEYNDIITRDKCEIIYEKENIGFAGANNDGIRYALKYNPDYLLIINNDTVVTPDFLNPLIKTCEEDEKVGIATGKIYYFDDKEILWFGGSYYDKKLCEYKIDGIGNREEERHNNKREIAFATACLWLLPVDLIQKVGFMSEDYFLYYEDADYCERVKQKGYKIVYEPTSVIYHKESRSTKRGSDLYHYYNIRNYLFYISKFREPELKKAICFKTFFNTLKEVVRNRLKFSVFVKAWSDFVTLHYGKIK